MTDDETVDAVDQLIKEDTMAEAFEELRQAIIDLWEAIESEVKLIVEKYA